MRRNLPGEMRGLLFVFALFYSMTGFADTNGMEPAPPTVVPSSPMSIIPPDRMPTKVSAIENHLSCREQERQAEAQAGKNADIGKLGWDEYECLEKIRVAEEDAELARFRKNQIKIKRLPECCHIGMTREEVKASRLTAGGYSWRTGVPDDIQRTITVRGTHELWTYRGHFPSDGGGHYLSFDSGILTVIQD